MQIEVEVNGVVRTVVAGASLLELLDSLGKDARAVAIEHNGRIVRRQNFAETSLAAGDRVEVVQFVQGGGRH